MNYFSLFLETYDTIDKSRKLIAALDNNNLIFRYPVCVFFNKHLFKNINILLDEPYENPFKYNNGIYQCEDSLFDKYDQSSKFYLEDFKEGIKNNFNFEAKCLDINNANEFYVIKNKKILHILSYKDTYNELKRIKAFIEPFYTNKEYLLIFMNVISEINNILIFLFKLNYFLNDLNKPNFIIEKHQYTIKQMKSFFNEKEIFNFFLLIGISNIYTLKNCPTDINQTQNNLVKHMSDFFGSNEINNDLVLALKQRYDALIDPGTDNFILFLNKTIEKNILDNELTKKRNTLNKKTVKKI